VESKEHGRILFAVAIVASIVFAGSEVTAAEYIVHNGGSIQAAVDNSKPGDSIVVEPGNYGEHISAFTTGLTIRSQSGNPDNTIIQGSGFTIQASQVTIEGFTIKGNENDDSGITILDRAGECQIENNIISNYMYGVNIPVSSSLNIISDNEFLNCRDGITVSEGSKSSAIKNEISNCQNGITFREGSENTISNNKISDCQSGITYMEGFENILSNNEISTCKNGINMGNGDASPSEIRSHVEDNMITRNDVGISVGGIGGGYIIAGNTISFNNYGFEDYTTGENLIYNNYFNNTVNVNLQENQKIQNIWNTSRNTGKNIIGGSSTGGNYWANPAGNGFSQTHFDASGDGISEASYPLNNENIDHLPLAFSTQKPEPVLPVANFNVNIMKGPAPLFVNFTDSSLYAAGRNWDFENDGNTDSIDVNPVHIYLVPGTYIVNLTAVNENGTNSMISTITVFEQNILPVANFSMNVTVGSAPLSVQFTDLSENAISWSWDFGNNGQPDSSEKNPLYIYTAPGTYTVNLTVSNGNGTASKLATINVTEGNRSNSGNYGSIDADETDRSSSRSSYRSNSENKVTVKSSDPVENIGIKKTTQSSASNGSNKVEIKLESGNKTINESSTLNKENETKRKENPNIPDFEAVCGVVCLLSAFLYRKN
jgi:parallel beta-helix repeat protein